MRLGVHIVFEASTDEAASRLQDELAGMLGRLMVVDGLTADGTVTNDEGVGRHVSELAALPAKPRAAAPARRSGSRKKR